MKKEKKVVVKSSIFEVLGIKNPGRVTVMRYAADQFRDYIERDWTKFNIEFKPENIPLLKRIMKRDPYNHRFIPMRRKIMEYEESRRVSRRAPAASC